ncbi:MSCRAMM family adhesin SdrC [Patescibacteria group bacterium]|nr:MSCRAMM family adhesin SdrC [Patescibacteria group bacterium]
MQNIFQIARGRFLLGLFLFALFAVSVWGAVHMVRAASTDNLSGYGWSSTIGWVSMNCTTAGSCASTNYGVKVDTSGLMSGYAWSSNAGWVSFNSADLAGCPTSPCEARFNKTTGLASGWARAIAGAGASQEIGGWGGWLHLAGTGHQVKAVGCSWEGYAWGGGSDADTSTVGWLSFKGPTYGVVGSGVACRETPAQCADGIDNDSDGLTDFSGGDPGCINAQDDSETTSTVAQCADSVDNDGDGKVDFGGGNPDPGCINASDDNETDPANPACSDGNDNDGDTKIDFGFGVNNDSGCVSLADTSEANPAQCEDGIDNDGDGKLDYPVPPGDRGCTSSSDNDEYNPKECEDGIDNDGDTFEDYGIGAGFDPQCSSLADDSESSADAQLTLVPTARSVRPGTTTVLTWSVVDVQAGSCTLSGNGDSWTLSGASGTKTTSAINSEVTYRLSCTDLGGLPVTRSATIKILPTFEEI